MVQKDLILKTLDNAIVKCSQRLTLPKKVYSPMLSFAQETINRKTEKGLLITDTGEIVHSKNGSKKQVDIFKGINLRDLYEEYGSLHIEHNHPSIIKEFPYSECLSTEDMNCLTTTVKIPDGRGNAEEVYPIKSITAEGTNGTRMTLVRGDNFNTDDEIPFNKAVGNYYKYWNNWIENYSDTYNKNYRKIVDEYTVKYGNKETLNNLDKLEKQAQNATISAIGRVEETTEFKNIQKQFREANCKLIPSKWK